ncbi:Predicted Zn-dependent peptidase [Marivirga sericea]|uniref:Predicted Zn-dependent peptidase n=1 Tax=Marivirga sericea TaxID=1028 RepID=A0A1X7JD50_9BACT|nr:pitrilysin family protein [Marivirga sericea]SMG25025.1 Predicted Zn-dependent peptidase [Marivirga sericea]
MPNRQVAPDSFMLKDLSLTKPKVKELSNGLSVHILQDDTNPVLKIDVLFPSGKVNDEKSGQSLICAKVMVEGTRSYPGSELQELLDHYGAHLDVSVDYDHSTVSLLCLKEHIHSLLPVLKSAITEPLFDEKDFEKIKLQQLQKIQVNNQKNALIATKNLRKNLLNGTPYANTLEEEYIKQISIEDVKSYFHQFFTVAPDFIVAGDFDDGIFDFFEEHFGMLEYSVLNEDYKSELSPIIDDNLIKREGSVQASVRMGCISIPRTHPDYFDLSITNEIFGGYFGSRLMKNIREDKGYTYGIYSVLINYKHLDYQIIGADVKIDHVEDTVREVYREMEELKVNPVPEAEIETIKNYMLGKIASSLDTVFHQSENYKSKLVEGADYLDYFDDYINSIRSITAQRVLEISNKYFSESYCVVKVA